MPQLYDHDLLAAAIESIGQSRATNDDIHYLAIATDFIVMLSYPYNQRKTDVFVLSCPELVVVVVVIIVAEYGGSLAVLILCLTHKQAQENVQSPSYWPISFTYFYCCYFRCKAKRTAVAFSATGYVCIGSLN